MKAAAVLRTPARTWLDELDSRGTPPTPAEAALAARLRLLLEDEPQAEAEAVLEAMELEGQDAGRAIARLGTSRKSFFDVKHRVMRARQMEHEKAALDGVLQGVVQLVGVVVTDLSPEACELVRQVHIATRASGVYTPKTTAEIPVLADLGLRNLVVDRGGGVYKLGPKIMTVFRG